MSRRATTIPRSSIFSLEDGTWVVQRGIDRVQELLTGKEMSFSSMDISFEITDPELDILEAQGIISQYDDSFVWLTNELVDSSLTDSALGSTTHYFVRTNLNTDQLDMVRAKLESTGLSDRYEVAERFGQVVIMQLYEDPFLLLSHAEDAQTLLAPVMNTELTVESVRFDASDASPIWTEPSLPETGPPLIRRLAPQIGAKTVVCIDSEKSTHDLVREKCKGLEAEIASAFDGKSGITLIQDADPAVVVMELTLPDLHGYKVLAYVRNNPDLAHIPVIIVSTLDTEIDRAFAFTVAQNVDYVTKPINTSEIRRHIWRFLSRQN